jgi:hypothetical protein
MPKQIIKKALINVDCQQNNQISSKWKELKLNTKVNKHLYPFLKSSKRRVIVKTSYQKASLQLGKLNWDT